MRSCSNNFVWIKCDDDDDDNDDDDGWWLMFDGLANQANQRGKIDQTCGWLRLGYLDRRLGCLLFSFHECWPIISLISLIPFFSQSLFHVRSTLTFLVGQSDSDCSKVWNCFNSAGRKCYSRWLTYRYLVNSQEISENCLLKATLVNQCLVSWVFVVSESRAFCCV